MECNKNYNMVTKRNSGVKFCNSDVEAIYITEEFGQRLIF